MYYVTLDKLLNFSYVNVKSYIRIRIYTIATVKKIMRAVTRNVLRYLDKLLNF